jgi:hypothetical protein
MDYVFSRSRHQEIYHDDYYIIIFFLLYPPFQKMFFKIFNHKIGGIRFFFCNSTSSAGSSFLFFFPYCTHAQLFVAASPVGSPLITRHTHTQTDCETSHSRSRGLSLLPSDTFLLFSLLSFFGLLVVFHLIIKHVLALLHMPDFFFVLTFQLPRLVPSNQKRNKTAKK